MGLARELCFKSYNLDNTDKIKDSIKDDVDKVKELKIELEFNRLKEIFPCTIIGKNSKRISLSNFAEWLVTEL